ncbi:hypothetical protein CEXT_269481 [Caerostris extrusa]|uniref:Uncharacterized protein n=1 Tax=Caerostris extrusa TaxID=172846 RepID=A0AAV4SFN9_CAEEX|nr:hypothetical protein CEXT_269481 [Caerostris extrusa]
MIHKCIIAFTVGLNLTRSDLRKISIIKSNFFFALSSPVGILLGVFVMDVVQGLSLVITSGILQGMAAGTFLYVTIFEVLFKELNFRYRPNGQSRSCCSGLFCCLSFIDILARIS